MLLSVPHVLSKIASQKLFQKIDLHFGLSFPPSQPAWLTTKSDWEAADKSESQRSADILTRIILDSDFAIHVKTMRVFVPAEREQTQSFAFQLGARNIRVLWDVSLTLSQV